LPAVISGGKVRDLVRVLFRQVIQLGAVGSQIVKFPPGGIGGADDFPIALPDGAVARLLPEEEIVRRPFLPRKIGTRLRPSTGESGGR